LRVQKNKKDFVQVRLVVANGRLYAIGGNGATDQVTLAVANGRLCAIGGNGTADQETVEIFDIERNQWKHHSYLNEGRYRPDVGVIQLS
ncbi:kelch repeat protein, partial [Cooperia oncophora]